MLESVNWGVEQFVHSTEVVHFSECPLSEAPLSIRSYCNSGVMETTVYVLGDAVFGMGISSIIFIRKDIHVRMVLWNL